MSLKIQKKKALHEIINSYDLETEYQQLKKVLLMTKSPVLFCHNDVQVGNILKVENDLMLIDFEFACYSFRGFDIGNHFIERMFNNHSDVYPFFEYDYSHYPSRDEQIFFAVNYIEKFNANIAMNGMTNHSGLVNLNEDSLIYEANVFALIALHCAVVWTVIQANESSVEFGWLEFAIARADAYFKLKMKLFPQGYPE